MLIVGILKQEQNVEVRLAKQQCVLGKKMKKTVNRLISHQVVRKLVILGYGFVNTINVNTMLHPVNVFPILVELNKIQHLTG